MDRKLFLQQLSLTATGTLLFAASPLSLMGCNTNKELFFDLSLAQWSLHRTFIRDSNPQGTEDPLNFARISREKYGINAVEYVNTFYFDKAENQEYLNEMKNIADNEGVRSVLIMCDAEGSLGDPEPNARTTAVENHYKWVDMAKFLGCHSIRVNAQSSGSYKEQMERAADGLRSLTEYAAEEEINVIVENHGGLSSNAEWLVSTIEMVDHPYCGTLPDFGNFRISEDEMFDYYEGTELLMPFAKGVSAKTNVFDEEGNEANLDYMRLMRIVKDAGYTGYVGIEYEGDDLSEEEGIIATKNLLIRVGEELS